MAIRAHIGPSSGSHSRLYNVWWLPSGVSCVVGSTTKNGPFCPHSLCGRCGKGRRGAGLLRDRGKAEEGRREGGRVGWEWGNGKHK